MAVLEVELVPAFKDNYIYLLREPDSGRVAAVDPGDAVPVEQALEARGWGLDLILLTHHHGDHTAGAAALKRRYLATVVGPRGEARRIPALDRAVGDGDTVAVGDQVAQVIETPGHTSGPVAYWFEASRALFCGDTLFALGCGRLFEGTAAEMWASLSRLRALHDDTRVYCGHEYTLSNARFALTVDPDNIALRQRAEAVAAARDRGEPTIPALLGEEKQTNPFLRADRPSLQAALGLAGTDPVTVFAELRSRKDRF